MSSIVRSASIRFGSVSPLARDVEERDHDMRHRTRIVHHRSRERADVDARTVSATDREVVDHHDLLLDERAYERQPLLRIRPAIAREDAVRLRVPAGLHVVAAALPHDLRERPVRVDQLAVRRTCDPQPDRQIVA